MKQTPYVVINEKKLKSNIKRMSDLASSKNIRLRPHIKTHKISDIAKLQIEHGAVGITVAKISEAQAMYEHGISDIFIAYPIVTAYKAEEVCLLNKKLENLIVAVDSSEGAVVLNRIAQKNKQILQVRLEIDTGLKRTGVVLENAVALAKQINEMEHLKLQGVFTFKGAVYQGQGTKDIEAAGTEEGETIVKIATLIRAAGIELDDISVGSTPTAQSVANVDGITEIRPGTYVFNDRMQVSLDVCSLEQCAAYVVATVVSKPTTEQLVIDGGSKTFATDVQPNMPPLFLKGFGHIKGHPDTVFTHMNEEHGMIKLNGDESLSIGDEIHIIPNHICSTVNLHNYVYLEKENGEFQKLRVEARGLVQ